MDNLLETIKNDYEKLCNKEYVFYLDTRESVMLMFKKENLPHLIGLHKLKQYYPEIRQMVDKNDYRVTAKNIFKIFEKKNINYTDIKGSLGWNTHLQDRMEKFTYEKIDSILRQTTMFEYIYEKGKTKNTKAKYVLIDKVDKLFLQLYIGYDEEKRIYFPNSYVPNKIKDSNLSRDTFKLIKTEIYIVDSSKKIKIETIEHKKIRDITELLRKYLKLYNSKNNELYNLLKTDKSNENILKEVNKLARDIIKWYKELIKFVEKDIFLNKKSNKKLKNFLQSAKQIPMD